MVKHFLVKGASEEKKKILYELAKLLGGNRGHNEAFLALRRLEITFENGQTLRKRFENGGILGLTSPELPMQFTQD
ncbi:MAG: hypothetical protein HXS54_18715 [Theionarchaea archaeon]|nr:hypothetical protein [Theionarchaea archaeon]